MAPKPKSSDPKRDRLMALVLLLQNATKDKPLTQDEIIRDLTIDDPKSNKLMKAYEGDRLAVRQKFERDKKDIRSNGIQVETSVSGDGTSGYWIDADSMAAVGIFFDEQEERVDRSIIDIKKYIIKIQLFKKILDHIFSTDIPRRFDTGTTFIYFNSEEKFVDYLRQHCSVELI